MPLLHKQRFAKKPVPNDLDPNTEIFYSKLTQEIFVDYDEYFERTILCNSLVWTCALSGKTGLTYSEALHSEEKARLSIVSFPRLLEKVILYLTLFTKRGNIKDLLDDVFIFMKDRYFIGETVSVVVAQSLNSRNQVHKTCKIIDVVPPSGSQGNKDNDEDDDDDDDDDDDSSSEQSSGTDGGDKLTGKRGHQKHSFGLAPAKKYKYMVELPSLSGGSNIRLSVFASQISRPKGLLTKDKVQIILKDSCEAVNNIWVVKANLKDKFSLNTMKFEQISKGPTPKFDVTFGRGEFSKLNQKMPLVDRQNKSLNVSGTKSMQTKKPYNDGKSPSSSHKTISKSHSASHLTKQSKHDNQKPMERAKKVQSATVQASAAKVQNQVDNQDSEAAKAKQYEIFEKNQRSLKAQKIQNKPIINMTDEEFLLWHEFASDDLIDEMREIEIEYEKQQRKEERDKEKERIKVEKQREKEYLKELKKPKEDLEFDKQTELPKPLEISTIIPTHLFGDALMIIEFLKCFESLEDALYSKSSSSALCNLLLFFLDSIFKCDEEENLENTDEASDDEMVNNGATTANGHAPDGHADSEDEENVSIEQLYHKSLSGSIERENFLKLAEKYTKLIRNAQGRNFRTIGLDVYTISEMLRLYFLTSGSKYNAKMRHWLISQRGGFTVADDIGVEFSLYESAILNKLESNSVYELEPEEKLKLLTALCHQLMSQVKFRDLIEDNFQQMNTLRATLRDMQLEENRRLKEVANEERNKKFKQKARLEEIKTNVVKEEKNAGQKHFNDGKTSNDNDESYNEDDIKMKKFTDDNLKKREEFLKKEKQLLDDIHELQLKYSLNPFGKDRYYRRYWLFNSIAGLYVEDDDQSFDNIFEFNDNLSNTTTNSTTSVQSETINGGKENHPHLCITEQLDNHNSMNNSNFKKGDVKWSFYCKQDDIDKLINSLNERGIRESELKQSLCDFKHKIMQGLSKCPVKHLSMNENDINSIVSNMTPSIKGHLLVANEQLEADFRQKLLDIEEQINAGSLGSLKVSDRSKWRDALSKGTYNAQCKQLTWSTDIVVPVQAVDNLSSTTNGLTLCETISDLSKALLQIEQAVEKRFLRQPLGDVQKTPDKRLKIYKQMLKQKMQETTDDDNTQSSTDQPQQPTNQVLCNWERSLMNCSSLSQLFIHLQTLDESIAWSKSALNARCRLCRHKGDAEKMLLCDKCDRGYHMYCLRPKLKTVPEGEWFCPDCKPKNVDRTPRKIRRMDVNTDEEMLDDYETQKDNSMYDSEKQNGDANSNDDINIDDEMADEIPEKKRKNKKRKVQQSTTAQADTNDNQRSKRNQAPLKTKQINYVESTDEFYTDEDGNYESASSKTKSKRARNNGHSDFHINLPSTRNNEDTLRLKICEKLIAEIMKNEMAGPFLKPVSKRDAPDYFDVIKQPMDFGSIKNKINNYKYPSYRKILDDIQLVFQNCYTYNEEKSPMFNIGEDLYDFFIDRLKYYGLNDDAKLVEQQRSDFQANFS